MATNEITTFLVEAEARKWNGGSSFKILNSASLVGTKSCPPLQLKWGHKLALKAISREMICHIGESGQHTIKLMHKLLGHSSLLHSFVSLFAHSLTPEPMGKAKGVFV